MNQPSSNSTPGRIAGIDYGTVRIGVALSDARQTIASPHENYTRRGEDADARWFRQLVAETGVRRFVVGLPVHMSGEESQKSLEARRFGQWLGQVTGLPVEFFDERLTTAEAERFLQDAQLTKKQRKARLDKLAAQIMLDAYLQSGAGGQQDLGSLDD